MDNILTYLKWRGDLSFEEKPFNEVDSLIFALISYIEWDNEIKKEGVLLKEACLTYFNNHDQKYFKQHYIFSPMIVDLIQLLPSISRYQNVKLSHYKSINDKEKGVQFGAICIEFSKNTYYISYRGTDAYILGWKEDFEMLHSDVILAQTYASCYLQELKDKLISSKKWWQFKKNVSHIYIGGHSKGGNLAMYAAITNKEYVNMIEGVYNFDGPGFRENFYKKYLIHLIQDKLHHYMPESSIFGRLLTHPISPIIIKGYSSGLVQHDAFYWCVTHDHFIYRDVLNKESDQIQYYFDKILLSKSDEEIKIFGNTVFKILKDMHVETLNDFTEIGFRRWLLAIKEVRMMSKEEYRMFYELLKLIFSQSKVLIFERLRH